MLAPVLLIALAWLAWFASREGPAASSLDAPGALRPAARADDVLTPPGSRTTEPAAPPRTNEPAAADHRSTAVAAREVRGVLRDANTGKPIPEVRVAVTRDGHDDAREVLRTDVEGRFRSDGRFPACALTIDPTPFEDDFTDWYRTARGESLRVDFDPRSDQVVRLSVDAPPFVVLEGDVPGQTLEAYVVLPGAERSGPDGTTWVTSEHRRRAGEPRRLADGSLLVAPSFLSLRADDPPLDGSGEAHVEVTTRHDRCRWWRSDAITLAQDRIANERVALHDRTETATLRLRFPEFEPTLACLRLTPTADRAPADAPATWRSFPEWADTLRLQLDVPFFRDSIDIHQSPSFFDWNSECIPAGEYLVSVRHPRFEPFDRRVVLAPGETEVLRVELAESPIGAPITLRARWEDPAGLMPALTYRLVRLDGNGDPYDCNSALSNSRRGTAGWIPGSAEPEPIAVADLPDARYRVEFSTSWGRRLYLPIAVEPASTVTFSGDTLDVLVENAGFVHWRIERDADAEPDRSVRSLELFRADGTGAGSLTLQAGGGPWELIAPQGDGWTYAMRPAEPIAPLREVRGAWRATRIVEEHGITRHVLVIE